eukprot:CAMPEP_0204514516 /NCGR_PEP_ID=MMETSP0661-20131031/2107_1 /ASSEMBLY_ACC=CAM_ASM_000606 /TAXON_ID=109239 /ORGANISM="Alexandrium margalefi, Strain AMGDE01CS-322" /LENGTH=158 /DNA_ID=CAMNT_0051519763 /DNA_START=61 /DNA_END=538 /DNA_ORIENTATION=+
MTCGPPAAGGLTGSDGVEALHAAKVLHAACRVVLGPSVGPSPAGAHPRSQHPPRRLQLGLRHADHLGVVYGHPELREPAERPAPAGVGEELLQALLLAVLPAEPLDVEDLLVQLVLLLVLAASGDLGGVVTLQPCVAAVVLGGAAPVPVQSAQLPRVS